MRKALTVSKTGISHASLAKLRAQCARGSVNCGDMKEADVFVGPGRYLRPLLHPVAVVIGAAVLLPLLLFGLAAWQSYGVTVREARERVERTTRILEEHALKVFETHRIVIQAINGRLGSFGAAGASFGR